MGGHDIVQSFKYNFFYYMSARTGYICVQAPGSLGLSDIDIPWTESRYGRQQESSQGSGIKVKFVDSSHPTSLLWSNWFGRGQIRLSQE